MTCSVATAAAAATSAAPPTTSASSSSSSAAATSNDVKANVVTEDLPTKKIKLTARIDSLAEELTVCTRRDKLLTEEVKANTEKRIRIENDLHIAHAESIAPLYVALVTRCRNTGQTISIRDSSIRPFIMATSKTAELRFQSRMDGSGWIISDVKKAGKLTHNLTVYVSSIDQAVEFISLFETDMLNGATSRGVFEKHNKTPPPSDSD